MTDNDVQQLLAEAELRLRTQNDQSGLLVPTDGASPSVPSLLANSALQPYVRNHDEVATADSARMIHGSQESGGAILNSTKTTPLVGAASKKEKSTAGENWFNLPKTELTAELKRDFQLLRMRSVLDPKRHYKKEGGKANIPTYSQVGTIIEGPTEFFSGRISKKDRKKTFVEEALTLDRAKGRFKSKYQDIQASKQSGKKAYYKGLQAKRNTKGK
ncbi:hypothetical protein FE257_002611 [Aspergillus nanangensis]|uniref:Fcf2 pre-rRNA processing C-terminal domain-containing protein n=1 Tax=Aspergillus nanangensis TaxID=2582783 RepID=A0AAD4CT41_ASPNN|nr:hypothetical protein FE257_002611 [Aspergillus nanangensis]